MNGETSSVKVPRYVHLMKGTGGYGFNLHGEKGVVGQYISAVDKAGPADIAGLCVGDRVIEVNGVNVEAASHAQVVARIKEDPERATLLVVDRVTDEFMKREGIAFSGDLAKYDSVVEILEQKRDKIDGHDDQVDKDLSNNHNTMMNAPVNETCEIRVEAEPDDELKEKQDLTEIETPSLSSQASHDSNSSSNAPEFTTTNGDVVENGPTEEEVSPAVSNVKKDMAAALPKPKRRTIKEEKTDNWAAKAALFNNL